MADKLKQNIPYQSEFSHHYASWARNHSGWAKMKKFNRHLAKVRLRQQTMKEIKSELSEMSGDMDNFGG